MKAGTAGLVLAIPVKERTRKNGITRISMIA
jgi:hypothetical protein